MISDGTITPLGTVQTVPTEAIQVYGKNPRRIPAKAVEQTAKSIRDFGWQQPLVLDHDLVIVAGHVRYAAARSLSLESVPAIIADLTPAQARAFRIADNRSHDYTSWDYSELVDELEGLGDEFADVLDLTDWTQLLNAFEEQGGGNHDLPAADQVVLAGQGYALTVEFASREDADLASPQLLAVAGVIDVRHPR